MKGECRNQAKYTIRNPQCNGDKIRIFELLPPFELVNPSRKLFKLTAVTKTVKRPGMNTKTDRFPGTDESSLGKNKSFGLICNSTLLGK